MSKLSRLQGIFTPNLVPLDQHQQINEQELRRYVEWLIQNNVHGLYPNGSTGEFIRFTAKERMQIVEIVADQAEGRVPILAGIAEPNVRETLNVCEQYAKLGVRAGAVVSPFYYKLSSDSVLAYFQKIANETPIEITLYNIPLFASPLDLGTIQRLAAECPQIIGIKDSSGDIAAMMRMIQTIRPLRPEFSFLTGWDASLLPMLMIGCDGGTHASSGVVPELTKQLFDATKSGDQAQAKVLQNQLTTLFDLMINRVEFPEGFRAGVSLRGFQMGVGRQPLTENQQQKLQTLSEDLQQQLQAMGFDQLSN